MLFNSKSLVNNVSTRYFSRAGHQYSGINPFKITLSMTTVAAPYWEPTMVLMQILVWRKIFKDGNGPSPGLFAAPYLEFPELSLISFVKPIEKYLAFEPRTETEMGKLKNLT
jgi:hypothetical protein